MMKRGSVNLQTYLTSIFVRNAISLHLYTIN